MAELSPTIFLLYTLCKVAFTDINYILSREDEDILYNHYRHIVVALSVVCTVYSETHVNNTLADLFILQC